MPTRQPIRYRDARKVVRQIQKSSTYVPESKKLSRPGTFHFQASRLGRLVIVDDLVLSDEERELLTPYLAADDRVSQKISAVMLKEDSKIWEFIAPIDVDFQELAQSQHLERAPLWIFERQAWCLPHIFAGLVCYDNQDDTALKHFDSIFATSSHDRMHAREMLARHRPKAAAA